MPPSRGATRPRPQDPAQYTPYFSRTNGALHCESVALKTIAQHAGTPSYVYSSASIAGAYWDFDRALATAGVSARTLCYAVKANCNLSVLRLFARMGSGFDIVSGGELFRLLRIGVPGNRVVFSGVGKTREEIREALRADILLFNAESEAELELLATEASRLRRPAHAAIRVNPDVAAGGHPNISTGQRHHKFGLDWAVARRLYLAHRKSRWIQWQGIGAHIGSQILSVVPFRRAVFRIAEYVRELAGEGVALRYFDFGGGIGIRYSDEKPLDFPVYSHEIAAAVRPLGCHLLLEPGRVLVGPAGIVLTRVICTKQNRGKTFVVVDAAMNDFIRPTLYGALHPITTAANRPSAAVRRVDVVGPVCETGDCFVENWPMAEVKTGDLLVIWGTGAYGAVAASNYNSRPRPAEVMVEGKRFRVIRRRESRTDLIRGE